MVFPCHQMDSRSFGKFVPVELGTYPPSLSSLALVRRVQRIQKQLFEAFAIHIDSRTDRHAILTERVRPLSGPASSMMVRVFVLNVAMELSVRIAAASRLSKPAWDFIHVFSISLTEVRR